MVLVCLAVVVWQALSIPGEDPLSASTPDAVSPAAHKPDRGSTGDASGISISDLKRDGLLGSLPSPQKPPDSFDDKARKQWYDELVGLIDDAAYLEDEASLRMLIVEFRNPDEEIAKAARTSIEARRDRNALPYLKEMQALKLAPGKRRQVDALIAYLNRQSVFEHMRTKNP